MGLVRSFAEEKFELYFNAMMQLVHETAVDKGWWDTEAEEKADEILDLMADQGIDATEVRAEVLSVIAPLCERNSGEAIALMHSELTEALEGLRHDDPPSDKIPEFTSQEEELADLIIRAMDYAKANDLRLGQAIVAKAAFNEGRGYKHGGKNF